MTSVVTGKLCKLVTAATACAAAAAVGNDCTVSRQRQVVGLQAKTSAHAVTKLASLCLIQANQRWCRDDTATSKCCWQAGKLIVSVALRMECIVGISATNGPHALGLQTEAAANR